MFKGVSLITERTFILFQHTKPGHSIFSSKLSTTGQPENKHCSRPNNVMIHKMFQSNLLMVTLHSQIVTLHLEINWYELLNLKVQPLLFKDMLKNPRVAIFARGMQNIGIF